MPAPHATLVDLINGRPLPAGGSVTTSLADSAIEHGMAPLLDDAARISGIQSDHEALVRLAMYSLDGAADTQAASAAIGLLHDQAESMGIEIAVFKGLATGTRWYARSDLRPAVDVDVFINPNQTDRLGEFIERITGRRQSRAAVESMVAEGRVFEYPLSLEGVTVDVHIDPMNLLVLTRQRRLTWDRTETVILANGRPVRTLDLELSIVQALLHLFRDNFADLLHVNDIALMLDDFPDWDFVAAYADAEGITDLVRFSLGFVCEALGRPSPLPTAISRSSRLLIGAIWPQRIRLRGADSMARSHRRQALTSLLIEGRRVEVARAFLGRLLPQRSVIDDRFEGCDCPYLIALLRWRLAQRTEIKRRRAGATTVPGHAAI